MANKRVAIYVSTLLFGGVERMAILRIVLRTSNRISRSARTISLTGLSRRGRRTCGPVEQILREHGNAATVRYGTEWVIYGTPPASAKAAQRFGRRKQNPAIATDEPQASPSIQDIVNRR